jgi:serine/threonine-protein kinase
LGVGGMAEVYLAEDPSLRRDIAVKVLPRSLASDPGYVERFRNEAQRVASLSHPHITPVYTFGEERGLLYLVMPRMKESLRERMEREGLMTVQEAARITNQIAAALYIAHQHGIVHRDVKPENILLDDTGKAMLTDFGIARELSSLREAGVARTLAATGLPVGTPEYMAPEQLRGLPATEQVDLYALGVVLYEMLTGHVPHDAATPYEVATAVLRDPVKPPSYYTHVVSPEVEQVILMAMAKDPKQRFQDMKEFALALRGAMSGQKPAGSGALKWTQYSPPAAEVAGAAATSTLGRSLASASSSLIRPPQIALNETAKRPTISQQTMMAEGAAAADQSASRKRLPSRAMLLLSGVVLMALVALAATGLTISNAMGLFTNSVGSPALVTKHNATSTPLPTATATTLPTATPTLAPTSTPIYVYVTATPAPAQKLSISPSTASLPTIYKSTCGTTSSAPIMISNLDNVAVTWQWTATQPSLNGVSFQWDLNNTGWHYGLPSDTKGIAAYDGSTIHTDSLALRISCTGIQSLSPINVTMTDSLGRSYTIQLTKSN